jgi:NADPH:quinone reductase-like Zn-dependent oxidoreductase
MEQAKPQPAAGEVQVEVHFSSLNPVDFKMMKGDLKFLTGFKFPIVFGFDFSGRVVSCGDLVKNFRVGDMVFGISAKRTGGCFAEYICQPETHLIKLPTGVSPLLAGVSPLAAMTSLQAIEGVGKVGAQSKVFINGASGGVGHFAVQIAKSLGATVFATASEKNFEFVKGLGADEVFDHQKFDPTQCKLKFDLIFDCFSGVRFKDYSPLMSPTGAFVTLLPNRDAIIASITRWFSSQTVKILVIKKEKKDLVRLGELLGSGKVKPHVHRTWRLNQYREALNDLEFGRPRGKVALQLI